MEKVVRFLLKPPLTLNSRFDIFREKTCARAVCQCTSVSVSVSYRARLFHLPDLVSLYPRLCAHLCVVFQHSHSNEGYE